MSKIAIFGAAILATALAAPTMAKETRTTRHQAAQRTLQQQDANGVRTNGSWNNSGWNNDWNGPRRDTGFWPANVAAGAVGTAAGIAGAAVGTAGAIAAAPFRTADAYAYNARYAAAAAPAPMTLEHGAPGYYDRGENGWYGNWDSYAAHNGIACRPGTLFKDGNRMRPCQ
jgi:hypothetical protein